MLTFKACDVVYFKFNKLMVYANDGSLEKVQIINENNYGIWFKFHNFGSFDVLDENMLKNRKGHEDGAKRMSYGCQTLCQTCLIAISIPYCQSLQMLNDVNQVQFINNMNVHQWDLGPLW